MKKLLITLSVLLILGFIAYRVLNNSNFNPNTRFEMGEVIDSFNGVQVHYNGMVGHTDGRNTAADGYNIGMKYQCVEFVKRYYYEKLHHKMPDSYGNAKDFFNDSLPDSSYNARRDLWQFTNGGSSRPRVEDLWVCGGHSGNKYGHVAIVTWVCDTSVAIIQQNPGPFAQSRDTFLLYREGGKWWVAHRTLLGWLRRDTTLVPATQ